MALSRRGIAATHETRLVVPFPPGGGSDRFARILASPLAEELGAPVVVQNAPEASGVASFAGRAPDGKSLLLGSTGSVVLASLNRSPPLFDPVRDLSPIGIVGSAPSILTVHPSLQATRLDELITHLRSQPGRYTMGSPGTGTVAHLAGLLFARRAGVVVGQRVFPGASALLDAHVGGEVHIAFESQVVERVQTGQLRAIAVMSNARVPVLEDVPTISEAGLPGLDVGTWFAVFAPRGMPEELRQEVAGRLRRALAHRTLGILVAEGLEVRPGTPDQLARFLVAEVGRWSRYLSEAGVVPAAPATKGEGR